MTANSISEPATKNSIASPNSDSAPTKSEAAPSRAGSDPTRMPSKQLEHDDRDPHPASELRASSGASTASSGMTRSVGSSWSTAQPIESRPVEVSAPRSSHCISPAGRGWQRAVRGERDRRAGIARPSRRRHRERGSRVGSVVLTERLPSRRVPARAARLGGGILSPRGVPFRDRPSRRRLRGARARCAP